MLLRATAVAAALAIGAVFVWIVAAGSGDSESTARTTSTQEKRAVRLQAQLADQPNSEMLMLRVMKAWIRAGATRLAGIHTFTKPIPVPAAVREDYEAGLRPWERYLEQREGKVGGGVAEMAANTYFQLVEIGSRDPSRATANAAGAVRAERIVCKHNPGLYTFSNLSSYQYFNGEYAAGNRAAKKAATDVVNAPAITPREVIEEQNEYRELGMHFVERVKRGFETLEESGEDELGYVIKGYGSPAGLNGYEPGVGPKSS